LGEGSALSLTEAQIDNLRDQLLSEREEIGRRIDHYLLDESMRDSITEHSMYDNHPADIGSELFERGKDLALKDTDSLRLAKINRALERMNNHTYGICAHCGKEIPFSRLEAEPAAEYCIPCQVDLEAHEISTNRPVEENFLYPGFGRTFLDQASHEQMAYDGEDAWQDVARYGTSNSAVDFEDGTNPDLLYIDAEERRGYVEDMEAYLTADIYGNPTGFTRNEAYRRNARHSTEEGNWMGLDSDEDDRV
jgi:YteA family regulatory protein